MHQEIYFAAKNGDINIIQKLYAQKTKLLWGLTFEGNTALHIAARGGHLEVVRWILSNVKGRCMSGTRNVDLNTPLHEAAKRGNADIISLLLCYNKCPAAKRNQFGESALLIASEHGHVDAVRVLVKSTPLYLIIWPRNDHQTCLHVAAYGGHLEVVKLILERPSFCSILHLITLIPDIHGATPLHSAVHGGHLKIVIEIMKISLKSWSCKHWFDNSLMTKKDNFGRCAVHVAAIKGHWDMVDEFLSKMPDSVEIRSTDLKTSLHFSVAYNQFAVVQKLLFQNKTEEVAKMLVEYLVSVPGVNVNAINSEGLSAIDIAANKPNCATITRILEDAGTAPSFIGHSKPCISVDSEKQNGVQSKIIDVDTLVASLIAAVTFAAIFQVPGGTEGDNKHQEKNGVARMSRNTLFQVFLFSDSLALFSSLTVIISWLFRERLQAKLRADRSLLANVSVLSLGVSVVSAGLAFLSAVILVTIPRSYRDMKNDPRSHFTEYRLMLGGEILTAFFVPSLALIFLFVLWVIEYYFNATMEVRARLKMQLNQVLIYIIPPFVIVFGIIMCYEVI